ncbi:MAG: hypothetical protein AAGE59_05840 [Cyanobacteria bacterium P01_F01_bin.86]
MSRFRRPKNSLDSQDALSSAVHLATGDGGPSTVPMPDLAAVAPQRRSPKPPRGIRPGFKTLIGLTVLSALLLLPFAFSSHYLDWLREQSFDLHKFLRGEWYKQATGFTALGFVLLEIMLTARKRSRSWIGRLKIPGSMILWRSVHIFAGVGLLAIVLVHTIGANGLNFNAVFLWVFFATTLTALVGVVAETGILESTRSYFGQLPGGAVLTKGPLIRGLRSVWLVSHIFFVCVFIVMLGFHIVLAYYYQ